MQNQIQQVAYALSLEFLSAHAALAVTANTVNHIGPMSLAHHAWHCSGGSMTLSQH